MTGSRSTQDDLVALIYAVQDGTIDDKQFAELQRRLKASARARELYVYLSHMHAGLICLEEIYITDFPRTGRLTDREHAISQSMIVKQPSVWVMASPPTFRVAVCALFVVLLFGLGYQVHKQVVQSHAPQKVAVVHSISRGTLKTSGELCVVNDFLETNRQYDLQEGLLELQMDSGVEVLVSGPTTFQLLGSNNFRLLHGTLMADVPRNAIGFEVLTPTVKVIDLGTRFGVHVNADGVSQTHVMQGVVNCFGIDEGQVGRLPKRLTAGESALRRSGGGFFKSPLESNVLFAEQIQHRGGIQELSGDLKFLAEPPGSVAGGECTSDQHIHVFLEQRDFALPEDVECSVPDESKDSPQPWKDGVLKKGLVVSVYYIHFDDHRSGHPDHERRLKSLNLKGVIRFESKILGVFMTNAHLRQTDESLGVLGTQYLNSEGNHRERDRTADDGATLFADRHAVRLGWGLGRNDVIGGIDAMRIIVGSER